MSIVLATILKLKRTMVPGFPGPLTWREIGKRLGMSGQGAFNHAKPLLNDPKHPRCPSCLRPLVRARPDTISPRS